MRTLFIVVVILAAFILIVPAYSAGKKTETGIVTAVIPIGEAVEITVTDDMAQETVYELVEGVQITKDGKIISAEDILVADTVTIAKDGDEIETIEIGGLSDDVPVTTRTGKLISGEL